VVFLLQEPREQLAPDAASLAALVDVKVEDAARLDLDRVPSRIRHEKALLANLEKAENDGGPARWVARVVRCDVQTLVRVKALLR
jgi:hypothetical protein